MRAAKPTAAGQRTGLDHAGNAFRAGIVLGLLLLNACGTTRTVVHRPSGETGPPVVVVDTTDQDKPTAPGQQDLAVKIPRGHFPSPGECRIWLPDTPPGRQPRPGDCGRLVQNVPAGAYLIYRPLDDPEICEVSIYHPHQPGLIIDIRWLDAETGALLERSAR